MYMSIKIHPKADTPGFWLASFLKKKLWKIKLVGKSITTASVVGIRLRWIRSLFNYPVHVPVTLNYHLHSTRKIIAQRGPLVAMLFSGKFYYTYIVSHSHNRAEYKEAPNWLSRVPHIILSFSYVITALPQLLSALRYIMIFQLF